MVENALYAEPAVFEAATVGLPDVRLGELVAAVVSLKPGRGKVGERELIATASKRFVFLSHFHLLRKPQFGLSSLPRFAIPVMVLVLDKPFGGFPLVAARGN